MPPRPGMGPVGRRGLNRSGRQPGRAGGKISTRKRAAAAMPFSGTKRSFGQKSAEIMLLFGSAYASPENTQETVSTLTQVTISYPDDADMDAVLAEMKKSFGEPAETVETYSTYDELPTEYTSDDNNQYWAGPAIPRSRGRGTPENPAGNRGVRCGPGNAGGIRYRY